MYIYVYIYITVTSLLLHLSCRKHPEIAHPGTVSGN